MPGIKGVRAMTKVENRFACPICKDGEGKARYTELGLLRHLRDFHKRCDADELTDRWVSNQLFERG